MKWIVLAALVGLGAATPATAQNAMAACGARYRAAKTAGSVPAGQSWPQFLATCRSTLPKAADAVATRSGEATPGQLAARARLKQCAVQYHVDKDAGKLPAGQTWPKYYSACNARAKG